MASPPPNVAVTSLDCPQEDIMNKITVSIKRFAFVAMLLMVITALTGMTANADVPPQATISASAVTAGDVQVTANSVAIAGAEAKGKLLLEEMRAQMPESIQIKWTPPTRQQIDSYGTLVHSLDEAKAVVISETKAYNDKLNKKRVKVAKLKEKLKFFKSDKGKKKQLKKKLKKAKKQLRLFLIDANWQHRPLVGLAKGVCFLNEGRNGNMDISKFRDCVGDEAHPDEKAIWVGVNPIIQEAKIVAVEKTDGTIEDGCLNEPELDVPPGVIDESMVLIVKAIAQAVAKVTYERNSSVALTVSGSLLCPDGSTVTDSATITKQAPPQYYVKEVTGPTSVEKAIAFGEGTVKADATATASAEAAVRDTYTDQVSKTLTLKCDDRNPYISYIQSFEHLFADSTPDNNRDDGGLGRMKVVIGDPEDSPERILANFSVANNVSTTGPVKILTNDPDYPVHVAIEGNQVVAYFWIRALALSNPNVAENFTVTVWYIDAAGQLVSVTTDPKPVQPDEF